MGEILMDNSDSSQKVYQNQLLSMRLRIWRLWQSIVEPTIHLFKTQKDNYIRLDSILKDNLVLEVMKIRKSQFLFILFCLEVLKTQKLASLQTVWVNAGGSREEARKTYLNLPILQI